MRMDSTNGITIGAYRAGSLRTAII
jgi:hypothetical protein